MCQISWGAASDLIEIRVDMGHSIKAAAGRTYAPFVPSPNPKSFILSLSRQSRWIKGFRNPVPQN